MGNDVAPKRTGSRGPVPRGKRALVLLRVYRSSHEVYKLYAKEFGLSLSDYVAVTLARFHGLDDPSWVRFGAINLDSVSVQQTLVDDPDGIVDMQIRIPFEHRSHYKDRAAEYGIPQRTYLGWVMATIHGEPPVGSGPQVLRFVAPHLREVSPGTFEAEVHPMAS